MHNMKVLPEVHMADPPADQTHRCADNSFRISSLLESSTECALSAS